MYSFQGNYKMATYCIIGHLFRNNYSLGGPFDCNVSIPGLLMVLDEVILRDYVTTIGLGFFIVDLMTSCAGVTYLSQVLG